MKITIIPGLLEHIRDALNAVVEEEARALREMSLAGGTLDIIASHPPTIMITSADLQEYARFNIRDRQWERLHSCNWCGREEWSEHADWECNCRPAPCRDDPDYRDG